MIAQAFACDYDGTIADRGSVSGATAAALERVRRSGRKLLLVTGRRLPDLETVCPGLDRMFDAVVAENGALLHVPGRGETRPLGPPPSPTLLAGLRRQRVPFDVGASIVATSVRFAEGAQAAIRESGEERALVFNRNDLMLLPPGVTKKTGLEIALATLGLSPHNAVGIGDAENDHAFLATCECAVAVADAIPALREHADYVTRAAASAGVVEFVDEHLLTDLAAVLPRLSRHGLRLGATPDGRPVMVGAHATTLLVAGSAAGGASALMGTLVGRLVDAERSVCLLAPAGHGRARAHLPGEVVLGGDGARPLPTSVQLDQLLREPGRCLVLDLSALPGREKADYAAAALTVIAATRAARGLPHWLVVDDAHHVFPLAGPGATPLRESLAGPLCVSAPSIGDLHRDVRRLVNALASTESAAFEAAFAALREARADRVFAPRTSVADRAATAACGPPLSTGEALFASVDPGDLSPVRFTVDAR